MGKRLNPIVDVPFGKTKQQHNLYYKRWREINREDYNKKRKLWADKYRLKRIKQARDSHLRVKFNITQNDYDKILKTQNNVCAICKENGKDKKSKDGKTIRFFHIDHCHKTNKIRGILCQSCNIGIGKLRDSVKVLESAISYIRNSTNVDDKAINIHDVQTS